MQHTVLITGTNRGLGLEFVKQYCQAKWNVIACCRNPDQADALQSLKNQYNDLSVYQLDITNHSHIESLLKQLKETPIDVVINNAGIIGEQGVTIGNINTQNMLNVINTNAVASIQLSDTLLKNVEKSDKKIIVAISSSMGSIAENESGRAYAYRSSKSALNSLMKSFSIDVKPKNIIVMIIHPGWVKTDMGGENALITPHESITGIRHLIDNATMEQSGHFLRYDGSKVEW